MKRYEVKQISTNWYGIWDYAKREFVVESTSYGIEVYRKLFDCQQSTSRPWALYAGKNDDRKFRESLMR